MTEKEEYEIVVPFTREESARKAIKEIKEETGYESYIRKTIQIYDTKV